MSNPERYCKRCNWYDEDYGCICSPSERVYQCEWYRGVHPEEVEEFNRSMEEWSEEDGTSEN